MVRRYLHWVKGISRLDTPMAGELFWDEGAPARRKQAIS